MLSWSLDEVPEHHGHVRGVGGFVNPTAFFGVPIPVKRKNKEAEMRDSLDNILAEQKEKIIAKQNEKMERLLNEQNAMWMERFNLLQKNMGFESSPLLDPIRKEGDSEKGSCSNVIRDKNLMTAPPKPEIQVTIRKRVDLERVGEELEEDDDMVGEDKVEEEKIEVHVKDSVPKKLKRVAKNASKKAGDECIVDLTHSVNYLYTIYYPISFSPLM